MLESVEFPFLAPCVYGKQFRGSFPRLWHWLENHWNSSAPRLMIRKEDVLPFRSPIRHFFAVFFFRIRQLSVAMRLLIILLPIGVTPQRGCRDEPLSGKRSNQRSATSKHFPSVGNRDDLRKVKWGWFSLTGWWSIRKVSRIVAVYISTAFFAPCIGVSRGFGHN